MDLFSVFLTEFSTYLSRFVYYLKAEFPGFLQGISCLLFFWIQQITEFLVGSCIRCFMFW